MMEKVAGSGFVLVVESQSVKTGLGARFGTWLVERNHTTLYSHMGVVREGHGGLSEQIPYQGLGTDDIRERIQSMLHKAQQRENCRSTQSDP
jgi:hypothetical protein